MPDEDHAAEAQQMERKNIFCVNGSPDFLDILRELFQNERYNVTTANYVPEVFGVIHSLRPDLIILDLVVGQRAGFDLLKRLSREAMTRGIPVVVTSTDKHLLDQVETDPGQFGQSVQILKPLDLDSLLNTVERLIGAA
jgi:CheY-like chemotaxis protein